MKNVNAFTAIIFAILSFNALAQSNYFDQSFGSDGISVTPNTNECFQSGLDSKGNIFSVGYTRQSGSTNYIGTVTKHNKYGQICSDIWDEGRFYIDNTGCESSYLWTVAVQSDNKVLVGGSFHYTYVPVGDTYYPVDTAVIYRFNPDGSLDSSFGQDGTVKFCFEDKSANVDGIHILPDGKILCDISLHNNSTIVKLLPNGQLDDEWADNGRVFIDFYELIKYSMTVDSDGSFYVYGDRFQGFDSFGQQCGDIKVIKYLSDGNIDESFGDNGRFWVDQPDETQTLDRCTDLCILSDGKLLLGCFREFHDNAFLIRLNADGEYDTSFGNEGTLIHNYPYLDLTVDNDDEIILAGAKQMGSSNLGISLTRLSSEGQLQSAFNGSGIMDIDVSDNNDYIHSISRQDNGKILVTGSSKEGGDINFTLIRLSQIVMGEEFNLALNPGTVECYPNPANDIVNFSSNSEMVCIEIYNMVGQKVVECYPQQRNYSFDNTLKTGMYNCHITLKNNQILNQKIIIE